MAGQCVLAVGWEVTSLLSYPGLPMCCISLLTAVSLRAIQRPTSFSILGWGGWGGYVLVNMQMLRL